MKKFLLATSLSLALCLTPLTGCIRATANTPTQATAPGYVNQADEQMKQTLDAAKAFYERKQKDNLPTTDAAGNTIPAKDPLSQPEKDALNAVGIAINAAQPIYQAFHYGQGTTQAQAQAAVDNVSAAQTKAQAQGVK